MKKTLDVKTCPFCGSIPEIEPWHGGAKTKVMISCSQGEYSDEHGGCSGSPQVTGETVTQAVNRWNRRYTSFTPVEVVYDHVKAYEKRYGTPYKEAK